MIFVTLIKQLFSWLPDTLWFFVYAVFAVAFLSIVIKLLAIVLD